MEMLNFKIYIFLNIQKNLKFLLKNARPRKNMNTSAVSRDSFSISFGGVYKSVCMQAENWFFCAKTKSMYFWLSRDLSLLLFQNPIQQQELGGLSVWDWNHKTEFLFI